MDVKARRYVRRILLIHVLLLLAVLVVVAGAAREIYRSTREQMIAQAEDRQKLLARQTAAGVQDYYQSILKDMDLMHRTETEQTDSQVPAEDRPAESVIEKANAERVAANRSPIIGQVMWKQLEGRLSVLFTLDKMSVVRVIVGQVGQRDPAQRDPSRDPGGRRGNGGPGNSAQPGGNGPQGQNPNDPNRRGNGPQLPMPVDPAIAALNLPTYVHLIGTEDTRLDLNYILDRAKAWIDEQKEPAFANFDRYNDVGVNLVCIPMSNGRKMVGVIPIASAQKLFLQPLNDDPATGAWLIDEAGTAMAASRPELVGTTVTNISDPELKSLADQFIHNHKAGTQVVSRSFRIGDATFAPAMVTAQPVLVGNKQWELFVTTSLDDVDGVVAKLLHKAVLWSVFVVLAITSILVSTAVQMIRARLRMERLQHEGLTRELSQARQIQLAWLPEQHPRSDAIDIAAVNSPASHISGDFYNWFELSDGRLVVAVGDVTGHGMAAAFLMATTQLLVRNTMVRLGDPGRCLEEVNRQLCVQVFNGQFVTMVLMVLDLKKGRMHVATAGHPAPLVSDGESFQPIPIEPQLVLGIDRETKYVTEQHPLSRHASLLLYTDGVVECPDSTYARFGDERLRRTLYGKYDAAQDMLDLVTNAVDTFRGDRVLDDDLTMVAVQLQPVRVAAPDVAAARV